MSSNNRHSSPQAPSHQLSFVHRQAVQFWKFGSKLARSFIAQDNLGFDAPVIGAIGVDSKSALDAEKGFWEEYANDSTKHSAELVKGLRDDLDSLLIFAGLFSAINTAFIVESMKDLKRDQAEATNDLLRILIRNIHDPSAYSPQDIQAPAEFATPKEAVHVNSFFFASLSCALLAALGAVMGKQWLNHYENDGPPKPLPEKCRERQMKLMGLERWHLEGIIEALPTLLQLSLFLFFAGLIRWLWDLKLSVSVVILSFSCIAFLFYLITTVISIFDPWSPFQSPVSRYLRSGLALLLGSIYRYIKRVYFGLRVQGYFWIISWPLVLLIAIFHTDGYMRIQPAVQIIRDLSPRRWRMGGSVFVGLLKLALWILFLWWFWTGLLFLNSFSIVISLACIAPIAAIRLLSGLYVARTFTTGTTTDPRGESCVLWLVRRQCGSSNSVSDQVVSAAFKLDPKVFEQRGALTLVLSAILRPRRRQIQLSNQKQWVLDSTDERLLSLVGPLGCLLSKPSVAKLGPVIFVEDDDDKEIWSELCDRVWRMVVSKPHDESLLGGVILLLNSSHIIQWNINPPAFDTLTLLREHTHESIQALSSNTLGTVPEITRSLQLNHLAILASAYTIYLEYNGVLQEAAHDDILENEILRALINTMEERHQRGDDFYSERLLHLWLQRDPETVLPLLGPKASLFSKTLQGLQRLDALFWKFPGGPGRARRSDSLGLSTLHLLLTRDHAFWYVPIEESGYIQYLQDILYAGRRLTSPQHLQLTLTDKRFETVLAQHVWGSMLIPLGTMTSLWSHHHRSNNNAVYTLYMDHRWVIRIIYAIKSLAKVHNISINPYCHNITPQEILQMMESVAMYLPFTVSLEENPVQRTMHRFQISQAYFVLCEKIIKEYNPQDLHFSDPRRGMEARENWSRTGFQQNWARELRRLSGNIRRTRLRSSRDVI